MNDILSVLGEAVGCDEDGVLTLREMERKEEKEEKELGDSGLAGVEDFREHTQKIIDSLEMFLERAEGKDRFEKERKQLYSQI